MKILRRHTYSKYLFSIFFVFFLFILYNPIKADAFSGGTGTVSDPYLISNKAEFLKIGNNGTFHYKLIADIDMSSTTFNGFGGSNQSWFTGSLDGNGYSIKNMTINQPSSSYVGLFSSIYSNSVTYTGVKNLTIENANVTGNSQVGILAGSAYGTSAANKPIIENITIKNSQVNSTSGTVSIGGLVGKSESYLSVKNIDSEVQISLITTHTTAINYVGGILGYSNQVDMTNIKNKGLLYINSKSAVGNIGGIAGYSLNTTITNTTNQMNIDAITTNSINQAGGITGYGQFTNLNNNYNLGTIKSDGNGLSKIGGIIGYNSYNYASNNNVTENTNAANLSLKSSTSSDSIGGIIGESYHSSNFEKNQNTGDILIDSKTNTSTIGGLIGYANGYSYNQNIRESTSTSTISITSATASEIGGLIGHYSGFERESYIYDSYSSGSVVVNTSSTSRYIGGLIGYQKGAYSACDDPDCTSYSNIGSTPYARVYNTYTDVDVFANNSQTGASYYPAGIIGYSYGYLYNTLALNPKVANNTDVITTVSTDVSYNSSANTNIRKLDTLTGSTKVATNITKAQAKQWATYAGLTWTTTQWGIQEGINYPYLKNVLPLVKTLTKPTSNQEFQTLNIPLEWNDPGARNTNSYEIKIEKLNSSNNIWSLVGEYPSVTNTYMFNVPSGIAGDTKFRYSVRGKNYAGVFGEYNIPVEFIFSNNAPTIAGTFTTSQKDLTVSIDKRAMPFTISKVADVDNFNYVKLFAEITGIAGSKNQVGTNLSYPITWTSKNYKLKLIPKFSSTNSTYDLAIVDAVNENTIIKTLVSNRPMQSPNAAAPETFTLKLYVEDYQTSNNSLLSTSIPIQQTFTVDTRNFLPRTFNTATDINGRTMSSDQGYNRIKFSGSIEDLDPSDGINVYYAVKLATDKVAGSYVLNPNTDTLVKTIPGTSTGVTGTFNAVYTIQESMANGNYVLLLYGADTRGGIGDPVAIPFTVTKTNPDIRFYTTFKGNVISTAQRQVVAKDTKLKMYFSAYNYTTFEYAGYVVRKDQQKNAGTYEDLKIRGAFTNDIASQFIGVDLSDSYFQKGDILVFKFRAVSNTGAKIEKDVRVLIGEMNEAFTKLDNSKIPTALHIQP